MLSRILAFNIIFYEATPITSLLRRSDETLDITKFLSSLFFYYRERTKRKYLTINTLSFPAQIKAKKLRSKMPKAAAKAQKAKSKTG
jgi:hypothetical protein